MPFEFHDRRTNTLHPLATQASLHNKETGSVHAFDSLHALVTSPEGQAGMKAAGKGRFARKVIAPITARLGDAAAKLADRLEPKADKIARAKAAEKAKNTYTDVSGREQKWSDF